MKEVLKLFISIVFFISFTTISFGQPPISTNKPIKSAYQQVNELDVEFEIILRDANSKNGLSPISKSTTITDVWLSMSQKNVNYNKTITLGATPLDIVHDGVGDLAFSEEINPEKIVVSPFIGKKNFIMKLGSFPANLMEVNNIQVSTYVNVIEKDGSQYTFSIASDCINIK